MLALNAQWIVVLVLGLLMVGLVIARMVVRTRAGAKPLTPELSATLEKLKPKVAPIRAERAVGDAINPEGAKGPGALALYKDELVFVHDAEQIRVALADITDTTQIRATSSMATVEHIVDAAPDYLLKVSWKGGSATFMVADPSSWQASIAGAR